MRNWDSGKLEELAIDLANALREQIRYEEEHSVPEDKQLGGVYGYYWLRLRECQDGEDFPSLIFTPTVEGPLFVHTAGAKSSGRR